jgi:hypothetical protein
LRQSHPTHDLSGSACVAEGVEYAKCFERSSVKLVEAGTGDRVQRPIVNTICSAVDDKPVTLTPSKPSVDRGNVSSHIYARFDHCVQVLGDRFLIDLIQPVTL